MGWLNNHFFNYELIFFLAIWKQKYSCREDMFISSAKLCNDLLTKLKKKRITQYTTFYHFANLIGFSETVYLVLFLFFVVFFFYFD